MLEQIERWRSLLEKKWWGIIVVYLLILIAAYTAIWALIEPLDIPGQINIFDSTIDRRFLHILFSLLLASNLTLLLMFFVQWGQRFNQYETRLKGKAESALSNQMVSAFQSQKLCPERKDLITERIATKDGKMTENEFASRVLWALHCKKIDERAAHEFLRGFSYDVLSEYREVFTLIEKR